MEEKLGEVVRLKALQSIQRIDSFMIDSTVNKLEKYVLHIQNIVKEKKSLID